MIILENIRNELKMKGGKTGIDAFAIEFQVFPDNAKMRFDFAGASELRFRPLLSRLAPPFSSLFFAFFLTVLDHPACPAG